MVDEVVTNPAVAARMGALDPRHFLTGGLAALPSDANGVPFNAGYIDTAGNLIAIMRANVAVEAVGRTLAAWLLELTDDPGMKDLLRYLIARDTMHQQQWLAVLEELGPEMSANAPGDFDNGAEYDEAAYSFVDHAPDGEIDPGSRWLQGATYDGKSEFRGQVEPARFSAPQPPLQPAPPEVRAGVEATGPGGSGAAAGIVNHVMGKVLGDRLLRSFRPIVRAAAEMGRLFRQDRRIRPRNDAPGTVGRLFRRCGLVRRARPAVAGDAGRDEAGEAGEREEAGACVPERRRPPEGGLRAAAGAAGR